MEENNRTETAPASANLVMEELCSYELTGWNSDAASSLTAENSGDILRPSVNARPDKHMAWTDEKHNKYLDSLEDSFVQQLHRSSGFLAWCTKQNKSDRDSSKRLRVSGNNTSEQFIVLQDGQWQKRIFRNDQPLSYISTVKVPQMHFQRRARRDTSLFSTYPKVCNEFYCEEEYLEGKRALSFISSSSSGQNTNNTCYHNSDGIAKEGSGQNFVDEDCKNDPHGISLAKKLKTAAEDISNVDQIVPSGKFIALGKSIVRSSTLEGQANHEDLSKDFDPLSM